MVAPSDGLDLSETYARQKHLAPMEPRGRSPAVECSDFSRIGFLIR